MTPAHITRLLVFAQHGQPAEYAASDLMKSDLEAVLLNPISVPVGEIIIEDAGQPFNSMQVRVHFYNKVPEPGTKLYAAMRGASS